MWKIFIQKKAKVDWVAKMIVDKLKNNSKMRLNEVIADVRLIFTIEITG